MSRTSNGMDKNDLLNYISQARKSGMGDAQIKEGLLQSGRSAEEVNEAMGQQTPINKVDISPSQAGRWRPTKAQKWIAMVGTIIILVLACVYAYANYLAARNYQEISRQVKIGQEELQKIQQRRALNSIASLPTYRNEEYGFEFRYPGDWVYEDKSGGICLREKGKTYVMEDSDVCGISVSFGKISPSRLSIDEVIRRRKIDNPNLVVTSLKISEITATRIQGYGDETYFDYSGNSFVISTSLNESSALSALNQILSTFRFIDSEPACSEGNLGRIYTARGVVERIGNKLSLTFDCVDNKKTVYIVESEISLESMVGQSVVAEFTYVEYDQNVQCVQAPCNPVKAVGIKIVSVNL